MEQAEIVTHPLAEQAASSESTAQAIARLKPGDHLCCIYQTEEEHRALLTPYLRQGLERDEKVLYIVDAHTADTVLDYLRDDGVEVERYVEKGQLAILTVADAYMREGRFNPDSMIALLRSETQKALDEGYAALRASGEMSWAMRGLAGSERLIEYESKLNDLVPTIKFIGLCQYDRRRFSAEILLGALATHPTAFVGLRVYDNFYYVPNAEFLGAERSAAQLQRWIENLEARHRAEEQVRKLSRAVEQSPATVVITDLHGAIKYVNPKFSRLTGYSSEEALGQNPRILKSGEMAPECYAEMWKTVLAGGEWQGVFHNKKKNGELYWESALISPIRDSQGVITELLAVKEDITDRVRMQRELADANELLRKQNEELQSQREELEALNEELQVRQTELEEQNRELAEQSAALERQAAELRRLEQMREEYLHAISHDLRTPLTAISGHAQLMERALLKEGQKERVLRSLEAIQVTTVRLATMTQDLMDAAQVESGQLAFAPQPLDLAVFVRELTDRLAVPGAERIVLDAAEGLPRATADPDKLERVLSNLLGNALKYSRPATEVRISIEAQDRWVTTSISDESQGIAAEELPQVFERYFRSRTARGHKEGLGLGLYITRGLVEAMGGQIGVTSETGKGSTFFFRLPASLP